MIKNFLRFVFLGVVTAVAPLYAQTGWAGGIPVRIWAKGYTGSANYTTWNYNFGSYPAFQGWQFTSGGTTYYFTHRQQTALGVWSWYYVGTVAQYHSISGSIQLNGTFMESSTGAGDGGVSASAEGTTTGQLISVELGRDGLVHLEPWKSYTVNVTKANILAGALLSVAAPPQYRVLMNNMPRNSCDLGSTVTITIQPRNLAPHGAAGFASAMKGSRIEWLLPLGSLHNGGDAGSILLADPGVGSSWASLFTPAALEYESTSPEVTVCRDGYGIRQVIANQVAVDVRVVDGTTYELWCFDPAQMQSTDLPTTFNGNPFVVYRIWKGATDTTLNFRKEVHFNAAGNVGRRELMTIQRTGTFPACQWTNTDWYKENESALLSVTTQGASGSGAISRSETLTTAAPTGTTPTVLVRNFSSLTCGEVVASETLGTSNGATVTFNYYTDPVVSGSFGYVSSVILPGGGWEAYDYYAASQVNGYHGGRLSRRYRPFGNTPATPTTAGSEGEVTIYGNAPDPFGSYSRSGSSQTSINGVMTSLSTTTYDSTATSGIVTATKVEYTNGNMGSSQPPSSSGDGSMPMYIPPSNPTPSTGSGVLTTVTKFYSEGSGDTIVRGRPSSVKQPDGVKQNFEYERAEWDGTTFGVSGESATRTTVITGSAVSTAGSLYNSSDPVYLIDAKSTKTTTIRDRRALVALTETYVWKSNAWQRVSDVRYSYDPAGLIIGKTPSYGPGMSAAYEGELKVSESNEDAVSTSYTYDGVGRLSTSTRAGYGSIAALTTSFSYGAGRQIVQQVVGSNSNDHLVTTRVYDSAGRLTSEAAPGVTATTYAYDVANRTQTVTNPAGGTSIETKSLDGRVVSKTGSAVVAEYYTYGADSTSQRQWTKVNIASTNSLRWQKTWKDMLGRTLRTEKITFGSGAPFVQEQVYETAADKQSTGHLVRTIETDLAATLFEYDNLGRMNRSGLDVNGNGRLDLGSHDRITDTDQFFEQQNGDWWVRAETKTYPKFDSADAVVTSVKRQKVSGLMVNGQNEIETTDVSGNVTLRVTNINASTATKTITTTTTGISNAQVETTVVGFKTSSVGVNGLTTTFGYDALGRATTVTDARNNTTTTAYYPNTTFAYTVTDATSTIVAIYGYDTSGRRILTAGAPDVAVSGSPRHTTYSRYDRAGRLLAQWGDATYPVSYAYNEYGEKIAMRTFRSASQNFNSESWPLSDDGGDALNPNPASWTTGDKTTWTYDAATGLLISKIDAADKGVTYTYNARGQLATRRWARGIVTTYVYDLFTAEQRDILYSDTTPELHYTYNRLGQATQIEDVTGLRTLWHCICGKLSSEQLAPFFGSRKISYKLNDGQWTIKGRTLGYVLANGGAVEQDLTYAYATSTARFTDLTVQTGGLSGVVDRHTFHYGYLTSTDLLENLRVDAATEGFINRMFESQRDVLTSIEGKWSGTTLTKYDYSVNALGQRSSLVQAGTAFADYGDGSTGAEKTFRLFTYDGRGQLTGDVGHLGSNPANQSLPLPGRRHTFVYDSIGNRQSSDRTGAGLQDDYNVLADSASQTESQERDRKMKLNQYHSRENNTVPVSGSAAPGVNAPSALGDGETGITVRGGSLTSTRASRQGRFWNSEIAVNNVLQPWRGPLTIIGGRHGVSGGTDAFRMETRIAEIPPSVQIFTYDDDGNLTNDGIWTYVWDAENRLITMTTTATATGAGYLGRRLEFRYDYLGRRIQKRVVDTDQNVEVSSRRFIYDGWNVIAEYAAPGGTTMSGILRSYAWGLDIARTLSDAGGVGALIQLVDHTSSRTYLPTYDGNGNIAALVNVATGALDAVYEYGPYGEPLRNEVFDTVLVDQPFRFSTKWYDAESRLFCYGGRYYSASEGRFLGRDPKREQGGANLYSFVLNDPLNRWDYLGMDPSPTITTTITSPGGQSTSTTMYYRMGGNGLGYYSTPAPNPSFNASDPSMNDDGGDWLGDDIDSNGQPIDSGERRRLCALAIDNYNTSVSKFRSLKATADNALAVRDAFRKAIAGDSLWDDAVKNAPSLFDVFSGFLETPGVLPIQAAFIKNIVLDSAANGGDAIISALSGNWEDAANNLNRTLLTGTYTAAQLLRYGLAYGPVAPLPPGQTAAATDVAALRTVTTSINNGNAALIIGTLAIENMKIYGPGYMNMIDQNKMIGSLNESVLGKQELALQSLDVVRAASTAKDEACK